MLFRKIQQTIETYLKSGSNKVLIIDGARQVGKTFSIRQAGKALFPNYIEVNMLEDAIGGRLFEQVSSVSDFYLRLSTLAGNKMKDKKDTLVFIDEIQAYPQLLTLLKFLKEDDKYTFIASGSLLGVTLAKTTSIPMGSIEVKHMYPLDFEEFLLANGFGTSTITGLRERFKKEESLDEPMHNKLMDMLKRYLLVGGLPDAVNSFLNDSNIVKVRDIQQEIHSYYAMDASKYDTENRLKIRRIYEMLPSNLENKKKRVVVKDIENKKGKRFSDYQDEFDYLISAGIALDVKAISQPTFPLIESSGKNLLKLYLNDVGILTGILYRNNVTAILDDVRSINLGTVYESVVAQELKAHGFPLYYYDNKAHGEVDFLVDDFDTLSVVPLEVKSGKNYSEHSALNHFLGTNDYPIHKAYVLSNERVISRKGKITYLPIYAVMFL
ncbi:MAG: AAA family ATPase [Bacteroidales bacterium]|nr:AAA family ATPase [Bacteroidales bacterium]